MKLAGWRLGWWVENFLECCFLQWTNHHIFELKRRPFIRFILYSILSEHDDSWSDHRNCQKPLRNFWFLHLKSHGCSQLLCWPLFKFSTHRLNTYRLNALLKLNQSYIRAWKLLMISWIIQLTKGTKSENGKIRRVEHIRIGHGKQKVDLFAFFGRNNSCFAGCRTIGKNWKLRNQSQQTLSYNEIDLKLILSIIRIRRPITPYCRKILYATAQQLLSETQRVKLTDSIEHKKPSRWTSKFNRTLHFTICL